MLTGASFMMSQAEEAHLEAMRIRETYFGMEHETVAQSAQYLSLLFLNAGMARRPVSYRRMSRQGVWVCLHASDSAPPPFPFFLPSFLSFLPFLEPFLTFFPPSLPLFFFLRSDDAVYARFPCKIGLTLSVPFIIRVSVQFSKAMMPFCWGIRMISVPIMSSLLYVRSGNGVSELRQVRGVCDRTRSMKDVGSPFVSG